MGHVTGPRHGGEVDQPSPPVEMPMRLVYLLGLNRQLGWHHGLGPSLGGRAFIFVAHRENNSHRE